MTRLEQDPQTVLEKFVQDNRGKLITYIRDEFDVSEYVLRKLARRMDTDKETIQQALEKLIDEMRF